MGPGLLRRFDPPLRPSEYGRLPFLAHGLQRRHLQPTSCQGAADDARRARCVQQRGLAPASGLGPKVPGQAHWTMNRLSHL